MVPNDTELLAQDAQSVLDAAKESLPAGTPASVLRQFDQGNRKLGELVPPPVVSAAPVPPKPSFKDRAVEAGKRFKGRAVEDGEKIKERAAQAGEKIKDAAEYVATPDFTIKDFNIIDSEKKVAADLEAAQIEAKNNPRKAQEILASMDADAILMQKILESRSGIKGKWNRLSEKMSVKIAGKGIRLSQVLGTALGAKVLGYGETALKIVNPVAGGITGGIVGGFWGYIRGKSTQESTSKWMADFNLKENADFDVMEPAELDMAIGVIRNAVQEGKVSGGREELRMLMRTYRNMKEARFRKGKEKTDRDPQKDLLEKIDLGLATEVEIGKALTAQAGEKYKELYEQILAGKKKEMWGSAIKGAVVGATIGTVLGVGLEYVSTWWNAHHGAQAAHGAAGVPGQAESIKQAEQAARDAHAQNAAVATNPSAPLPHGMTELQRMDLLQHASNLVRTPGAHLSGFTPDGLHHFSQMLQSNDSLHNITHEATINNIDLGALTNHGQKLGDFIMTHKDAFLHLTPEIQRQVLSYPSVAAEIMASTTSATATASLSSAVMGGVALGAIGFGSGEIVGQAGKKEVRTAYDKVQEAGATAQTARDTELAGAASAEEDATTRRDASKENAVFDETRKQKNKSEAEAKERTDKKEANIKESINQLKSKDFILHKFSEALSGGRKFRVSRVVPEIPDGLLFFVHTAEEEAGRIKGDEIFPEIHLKTLLNRDGTLNQTDDSKPMVEFIDLTIERPERKATAGNESEEFERMKKESAENPETYFDAKIIPDGKGPFRGKEVNKYKIKIGSGQAKPLAYENSMMIESAGLAAGGVCRVKILEVTPSDRYPGQVYRLKVSLKPKEELKPEPTEPPVPTFEDKGAITATDVAEFGMFVEEFGKTASTDKPSERVVVKFPNGKYYQINIFKDNKYSGQAFNFTTGELSSADFVSIKSKDIASSGYSWFLENKK